MSEFESHWAPHSFGLVLHQSKALCKLQKLIDLGNETLLHPPYFSSFSPISYHFVNHLDIFLCQKTFHYKGEVEMAFKDSLASKLLEFYYPWINNLVDQWQKYIDVQGSNFHRLKYCLNSFAHEWKFIIYWTVFSKQSNNSNLNRREFSWHSCYHNGLWDYC